MDRREDGTVRGPSRPGGGISASVRWTRQPLASPALALIVSGSNALTRVIPAGASVAVGKSSLSGFHTHHFMGGFLVIFALILLMRRAVERSASRGGPCAKRFVQRGFSPVPLVCIKKSSVLSVCFVLRY